jgi:alkylhydroperoxidase family enzyme
MFKIHSSRLVLLAVICALAVAALVAAEPRLRPVAQTGLTEEQRALTATYSGAFGTGADFRTLLVHAEAVKGVLPFANYILRESTLTPRHRDLLILRTAWNTRSAYLWSKHERGIFSAPIVVPITGPPVDPFAGEALGTIAGRSTGFSDFERTLLSAADELHQYSFIRNETWAAMAKEYSVYQLMDAAFTVAEMTMIAAIVNSVQTDLEPGWVKFQRMGARPSPSREIAMTLPKPRIDPVVLAETTPEIRAMLDPSSSGRDVAAVYRTFARHPTLYPPRQILSEYIRTKSTLSPRVREMLILRIGWRCRSAYEWAAHAPAGRRAGLTDDQVKMLARPGYDGWNAADAAIVRAADELFTDDTVSDATWKALDDQFDERQLLDVLITSGGYRMVSMVLNTFGVPAEPNSEPFP